MLSDGQFAECLMWIRDGHDLEHQTELLDADRRELQEHLEVARRVSIDATKGQRRAENALNGLREQLNNAVSGRDQLQRILTDCHKREGQLTQQLAAAQRGWQEAEAREAVLRQALEDIRVFVSQVNSVHDVGRLDRMVSAALAQPAGQGTALQESAWNIIGCAAGLRSHVWTDRQLSVLVEAAERWRDDAKAAGWGDDGDAE